MAIVDHTSRLRDWAAGMYTVEAAVELLVRGFGGRFAAVGQPWVHTDRGPDGRPWIDFESMPAQVGVLSSGERALLLIAASIAGGSTVDLAEVLPALSREHTALVLAAVAHAAGSHEQSDIVLDADGRPVGFTHLEALYRWP